MERNQELSISKIASVGFLNGDKLRKNYDLSKGERIIGVEIKVTVGNDGKIIKEEFYSFKDEYNKLMDQENRI